MDEPHTPRSSLLTALWAAARNFSADGCFNKCAAISYYALLSVVPFISFLASMLGYALGSPEEGVQVASEQIRAIIPQLAPQLIESAEVLIEYRGTIGVASVIATVWVARLVFASIQTAISQIFHRPTARLDWHHLALRALWDTTKPFLLFFSAATLFALDFALQNFVAVLRSAESSRARAVLAFFDSFPNFPLLATLAITVVIFAPTLKLLVPTRLAWRAVLPAAIFAALGWEAANQLFAVYLRYTSAAMSFSGSAGAAVIFMLWIYYAAAVLLYSVEFAAALSGQRS